MSLDRDAFRQKMIEANRAIIALESIEKHDDASTVARVVSDAVRSYRQIAELPVALALTPADTQLLHTTLELLRTKLRSFGQTV